MRVRINSNILTLLMASAMVNCGLICEYWGQHDKVDALVAIGCDIVTYLNAEATALGRHKVSSTEVEPKALLNLKEYNCKNPGGKLYYGLKICVDKHYSEFDSSISNGAYLSSVESAMKDAKSMGFDGFVVTLCQSTDPMYTRLLPSLLNKVKAESANISLPYGIRIFGRINGFPLNDHLSSAEFFTVANRFSATDDVLSDDEFQNIFRPEPIIDHWSNKSMPVGKMIFELSMLILDDRNFPAKLESISTLCQSGIDENIIQSYQNFLLNAVVQPLKAKGVTTLYISTTDYDDVNNACNTGAFPITNTLKQSL